MKEKTVLEIESRLAEIEEIQRKHSKRDFDAELLKVMTSGGDVDALEQKQLDDERATRRLRVEKQALELELPIATKRKGMTDLESLRCKEGEQRAIIIKLFANAEQVLTDSVEALTKLNEIDIERMLINNEAKGTIDKYKLDTSLLDQFAPIVSEKLSQLKLAIKTVDHVRPDISGNGNTCSTGGRISGFQMPYSRFSVNHEINIEELTGQDNGQ